MQKAGSTHFKPRQQIGVGTPQPLYPHRRALVTTVQEAVWAPGLVWKGMEKLNSFASQLGSKPGPSSL